MKSKHISILPGNSDGDSAASVQADSPKGFASYRARYQAFLNQQSHRSEKRLRGQTSIFRYAQGLVSFAIFIALFLAILTLFGFGLSQLGLIAKVSPDNVSAASKQPKNEKSEADAASARPKRHSRNKQ